MAKESQRHDLEAKAREHAVRLLRNADWADRAVWTDNKFHIRQLLGWMASISTDHEVQESVAAVVTEHPELLEPILIGISQRSERFDREDWSRPLGIEIQVKNLPTWFPTSVVATEIRRQFPSVRSASRNDGQEGNIIHELAVQVLHLDESRPA